MALTVGSRLGHYDVTALIGEGGMGQVYQETWVAIPEGPFLYGDENRSRELPAFAISRYPVTNAQYEAFVNDGGYDDARWWSSDWVERTAEPDNALPDVFLLKNHPRVNVSWYEAEAFTRWLADKTGRAVGLPTEEEWEKAARGDDGRSFPWEGDFDSSKCNSFEASIRSTTAVGLFPGGRSFYQVFDMSGNVWEWTRSMWSADDDPRVLRGGSFVSDLVSVRAAARDGFNPGYRGSLIGFRVVVSPFSSDSEL